MESPASFFGRIKGINPLGVDIPIPIPSIFYRNSIATNAVLLYQSIVSHYIPRILAEITKYNVIQWVLGAMGIRYEWLVMLLIVLL